MIVSVIFSILFLISIALYIIGSAQKLPVLEKTAYCFSIPMVFGIAIPLQLMHLPDSLHTMVISLFAVFFSSGLGLIKLFRPNTLRILKNIFFILTIVFWLLIYHSVFFIYRINILLTILFSVLCVSNILFFLIKLHIKKIKEIISFIINSLISCLLFYICSVTLIYGHTTYSILCFIGSIGYVIYPTFMLLKENTQTNIKSVLPDNLIFIISTLFMYGGTVLMQF